MARAISNIVSALIFAIAISALISLILISFHNLVSYTEVLHQVEMLEMKRASERLRISANLTSNTLTVNMTNVSPVVIDVISVVVHDRISNSLKLIPQHIIIPPGCTKSLTISLYSINATVLFITSRGTCFIVVIENGVVKY